ncbi:MAG TPA: hypothetical protein VN317_05530, partial [Candidatus Methanoperedens sp.]|nr:hypothetical protein [Candidatus Methanoperedens sp.]
MHIGLDFDNTVALYDRVFHRRALEEGLIGPDTPARKRPVRDAIRALPDGDRTWTELQGVVYGRLMAEAEPAPGVEAFLLACRAARVRVSIISHKTEYPEVGERVSLRAAARSWLEQQGFATRLGVPVGNIAFVGTQDEKIERIRREGCTHFVDDLVEVLARPDFPAGVERILYDPAGTGRPPRGVLALPSWERIRA